MINTQEENRIIQSSPSKCSACSYKAQDDKDRVMVVITYPHMNKESLAIVCPNIKTNHIKGCINFDFFKGKKLNPKGRGKAKYNKINDKIESLKKAKSSTSKRGNISRLLTKDVLEYFYYVDKKSLEDIALDFKCTRQMVKHLMDQYGIERRRRGKARVLAIKQGKFDNLQYNKINENFFSQWSPEMAWVLGLLFTDGNIQNNTKGLRVSLSSIDLDLLENVNNLLESSKPISKRVQSYNKSKHIYCIEFYREKMRKDLIKLGLVENKSLIMKFPAVPDNYKRHFIRGCWDGDGSVYVSNNKIRASFVSGSLDFIESLVHEMYEIGIVRKKLRKFSPSQEKRDITKRLHVLYPHGKYPLAIHQGNLSKNPSYSIKIDSKENIEKLFYYFYDGVDDYMYLTRKRNVFAEGLGLVIDKRKEK